MSQPLPASCAPRSLAPPSTAPGRPLKAEPRERRPGASPRSPPPRRPGPPFQRGSGPPAFPESSSAPPRRAWSSPWLLRGSRSDWWLAFSLLGPGPGLSPGFQGGCSPGIPVPGGDRCPFWARSEGRVCEPPGAEALGLGQGGPPCGPRSLPAPRELHLSRTRSEPRLGLGWDPRDFSVPGLGCGWPRREACPLPKPLGGSLLCFLGVSGYFRLFSE